MRWPWQQQQQHSAHEVTTAARLQAAEIMINTIFQVLTPDQQGRSIQLDYNDLRSDLA
jgi:hypothetical protein